MAKDEIDEGFEVADGSHLSDADWAEINNLKALYRSKGVKALNERMHDLAVKEPTRHLAIWGAVDPEMLREAVKDSMAAQGINEADVRDMIRKLESPAPEQ